MQLFRLSASFLQITFEPISPLQANLTDGPKPPLYRGLKIVWKLVSGKGIVPPSEEKSVVWTRLFYSAGLPKEGGVGGGGRKASESMWQELRLLWEAGDGFMAEREKSVGKQASWSNLLNLNEHECQEANVSDVFWYTLCGSFGS